MEPNISNDRSTSGAQSGTWFDPELDGAEAGECAPEPVGECSASSEIENPAVRGLVESFEATSRASVPPRTSAPGNNNAERTSERPAGPYAEAGTTRAGDYFAGTAALKGHDAKSGADVEVFSASAQVGRQNEVQIGAARMGLTAQNGGFNVNVNFEVLTARANAGELNDDGSVGLNAGAMAVGVGEEATVEYEGWQATVGLSASLGAAFHTGERDSDGDGVTEGCFKGSVGPLTLGVCTEFP